MARPATGTITESGRGKDLRWRLRLTVAGQRRSLMLYASEGHTAESAQQTLDELIVFARRGVWMPPSGQDVEVPSAQQSHPFGEIAQEWWKLNRGRWRENTLTDYRWRLNSHLLPFFGPLDVAEITPRTIDEYTADRLAESKRRADAIERGKPLRDDDGRLMRPLGADAINKTLTLLGAILDYALEADLIQRNPYRVNTSKRKVRGSKPKRRHLDSADKIGAVLLAASKLDGEAVYVRGNFRRAAMATLIFGGLRASELTGLRWRDVDLDNHRLRVEASKTDAGRRYVEIVPALLADLTAWKGHSKHSLPGDFVFGTKPGTAYSTDNLRSQITAPTFQRASALLEADGKPPLVEGLTPHAMRRTCASVLIAVGWDPGRVMDQLGHSNPNLTLAIYRQTMNRAPEEKAALELLVKGQTNLIGDRARAGV